MLPPDTAGAEPREETMALIVDLKGVQDRLKRLREGLRQLVEER